MNAVCNEVAESVAKIWFLLLSLAVVLAAMSCVGTAISWNHPGDESESNSVAANRGCGLRCGRQSRGVTARNPFDDSLDTDTDLAYTQSYTQVLLPSRVLVGRDATIQVETLPYVPPPAQESRRALQQRQNERRQQRRIQGQVAASLVTTAPASTAFPPYSEFDDPAPAYPTRNQLDDPVSEFRQRAPTAPPPSREFDEPTPAFDGEPTTRPSLECIKSINYPDPYY